MGDVTPAGRSDCVNPFKEGTLLHAQQETLNEVMADYERLRTAALEANKAMRDYNRNGITWLELDAVFARLEAVLRG